MYQFCITYGWSTMQFIEKCKVLAWNWLSYQFLVKLCDAIESEWCFSCIRCCDNRKFIFVALDEWILSVFVSSVGQTNRSVKCIICRKRKHHYSKWLLKSRCFDIRICARQANERKYNRKCQNKIWRIERRWNRHIIIKFFRLCIRHILRQFSTIWLTIFH